MSGGAGRTGAAGALHAGGGTGAGSPGAGSPGAGSPGGPGPTGVQASTGGHGSTGAMQRFLARASRPAVGGWPSVSGVAVGGSDEGAWWGVEPGSSSVDVGTGVQADVEVHGGDERVHDAAVPLPRRASNSTDAHPGSGGDAGVGYPAAIVPGDVSSPMWTHELPLPGAGTRRTRVRSEALLHGADPSATSPETAGEYPVRAADAAARDSGMRGLDGRAVRTASGGMPPTSVGSDVVRAVVASPAPLEGSALRRPSGDAARQAPLGAGTFAVPQAIGRGTEADTGMPPRTSATDAGSRTDSGHSSGRSAPTSAAPPPTPVVRIDQISIVTTGATEPTDPFASLAALRRPAARHAGRAR